MQLNSYQKRFVEEAEENGFEVDYTYSGRGMYGKTCPSVRVDYKCDFPNWKDFSIDQMGMGYVIYAG